MEEEVNERENENQNSLEKFGPYDPSLDLSRYIKPPLDLSPVFLWPLIDQIRMDGDKYQLPLLLDAGKTAIFHDLYHRPNMLLAGTIASGKSQFIYNQLFLWLHTKHPAELKFIICRSKPVDYSSMALLEKHFMASPPGAPIIADPQHSNATLIGINVECDLRLSLFQSAGVKNLQDYNNLFVNRRLNPEDGHRYLPDLVLVIDDLYTFLDKDFTAELIKLSQQNLYTGIYILAATSQITARGITPQLRANFSLRLSMKLMSKSESRKILDTVGAEELLNPGEILYPQGNKFIKGAQPDIPYATMRSVCEHIGSQRGYSSAYLLPEFIDQTYDYESFYDEDRDALFDDAARLIVRHQLGSVSLLQRKLKLGYNRAGRIIDQLEQAGIVGQFEGANSREVLYPDENSLEQYLQTLKKQTSNSSIERNYIGNEVAQQESKVLKNIDTPEFENKKKAVAKKKIQLSTSSDVSEKKIEKSISTGWVVIVVILSLIIYLVGGVDALLKWLIN